MDQHSILTKTAKGLAEATGKTGQLSRALRNLLKAVDGRTSIADLAEKFTRTPEAEVLETLQALEAQGFVRELPRAGAAPAAAANRKAAQGIASEGADLDFTEIAGSPAVQPSDYFAERRAAAARAEAEATARARAEGEAAARAQAEAEAAAKAKADAEAAAKAEARRAEAAALVRAHHEAKTRQAAEAKAKAEAEAAELRRGLETERKAREELERKAKEDVERAVRDAQEWARREAEERGRTQAEELRAKLDAERKAKEDAERAVREAEDRMRRDAEERAQAQAEARVRKEIEELAQRATAERARREAELREAKERLEAEESTRRQAVEQARREAGELREKLEAERTAREDAERRARDDAERQAREQTQHRAPETTDVPTVTVPELAADALEQAADERAEEMSRRFREEQAKRDAVRQAQREEAERMRAAAEAELREQAVAAEAAKQERLREEEERRRAAEEAKRGEAEEKARAQHEAVEKARAAGEAAMRTRQQATRDEQVATERRESQIHARKVEPAPRTVRRARRRGRVAAVFFLLVIGAFAAAYFMPLDAGSFEREATARFGTPVKIGSAHLTLLPMPALRFDRVAIGPAGDVKIATVSSQVAIGALFDRQNALKTLELDGVQIPASWAAAAIWGKGRSDALRVEHVIARGVKVEAPGLELPALTVDARLDAGGSFQSLSVRTADGKQTFNLTVTDGKAAVEISASAFQLPFPGAVQLGDLVGSGTLTPSELTLKKFSLGAFGGSVEGNARVRWGATWSVEGEFIAISMNPRLATASLVPTGRLEGKGTFSMRAPTPEKLHEAAWIDATFTIKNGTLGFVDLTRALQGGNARGGTTSFGSLDGNASFSGATVRLTRLRLAAGLLNAAGDATVDPGGNLVGRLQVDLTSQARGVLTLSGTVAEPHVKR